MVKFGKNIYQFIKEIDPAILPLQVTSEKRQTLLSPSQERIILLIEQSEKISMSDIAKILAISKPSATETIDRLIQLEYVNRIADPRDRRKVYVSLSLKGKAMLSKIRKEKAAQLIKWLEQLSEEEQIQFFKHAEGMNRLIQKLKGKRNIARLSALILIGIFVFTSSPVYAVADARIQQYLNETRAESENTIEKITAPIDIILPVKQGQQPELTLDEALEFAFIYHPSIQRSFANIAQAKARVGQAWAPQLPQIFFDGNFDRTFQKTIHNSSPPFSRFYNTNRDMSFTGNLLLWDFGRTLDQVSRQKHEVIRTRADAQAFFDQVLQQVRNAFYEVIRAQEFVVVAEETLAQNKERLRQIKGFYEVGLRPKFDVTSQEVEVENARLDLIVAQNALEVNKVNLNNAMGINIPFHYIAKRIDPIIVDEIREEEAIALALGNRPELEAFRQRLKAQEKQISQLRKAYFPTVTGFVNENINDSTFIDPISTFIFGLQGQWNIFDGLAIWHQITEAKEFYRSLSADERQQILDVIQQTSSSYYNLREARQRIETSKKLIQFANESLESAEERYRTGIGNIVELRDAQLRWTDAQNQLVSADADYQVAEANLDRSIGLKLSKILLEQEKKE